MPLPDTARQVQVFDPESRCLLATGMECGEDNDGHHHFSCARGNGALLTYYFGKGKRDVVVRSGPNEGIRAHLATRWKPEGREWVLDW